MTKIISAITAIAIGCAPVIASAEPSQPTSFSYNGDTYTYTTDQVGSKKVLRGQINNSGSQFEFYVGEKWVDGSINGNPVSFSRKSVRHLKGIVVLEQLAAR